MATIPSLRSPRHQAHRYITERKLPDSAIDLLDEAAARLRMQQESKPEAIADLEREVGYAPGSSSPHSHFAPTLFAPTLQPSSLLHSYLLPPSSSPPSSLRLSACILLPPLLLRTSFLSPYSLPPPHTVLALHSIVHIPSCSPLSLYLPLSATLHSPFLPRTSPTHPTLVHTVLFKPANSSKVARPAATCRAHVRVYVSCTTPCRHFMCFHLQVAHDFMCPQHALFTWRTRASSASSPPSSSPSAPSSLHLLPPSHLPPLPPSPPLPLPPSLPPDHRLTHTCRLIEAPLPPMFPELTCLSPFTSPLLLPT